MTTTELYKSIIKDVIKIDEGKITDEGFDKLILLFEDYQEAYLEEFGIKMDMEERRSRMNGEKNE